jgi:dephospho-CoA kinase
MIHVFGVLLNSKINKVMARKKKVEEEQPVTAEVVETKKKSSKKAPKTKMSAQKESIQETAQTSFQQTSRIASHKLYPDIVDTDGLLDRKKLGDKVFGNAQATKKLESILHPIIRAEVSRQKQELIFQGCKYAVYDVPLLFETKSEDSFDAVIVVTTSRDLQIQRMKERGLNLQEIEKRLSSQLDLQFKVGRADYVIENLGTYRDLESQVEKLITWIKDFKISV